VARYHRIAYDATTKTFSYELDADSLSTAENLDASYLLKTDRHDLSAEDVWRVYTLLTKAEEAFRAMKSPLAERPIFHQVERRVETHVFLCVLAYHLVVAIEKTLSDKGLHTSFGIVRETLRSHQVCTIVMPTDRGEVLRIRRSAPPNHNTGNCIVCWMYLNKSCFPEKRGAGNPMKCSAQKNTN